MNILYSNWIYALILGILAIIVIRQTYLELIKFSRPKLYLDQTEIKIQYFKFGVLIGSKSIAKKDIVECTIIDISNWILQGFCIILKTKNDTTRIGLALIHDDAKLIEKKIKNWL